MQSYLPDRVIKRCPKAYSLSEQKDGIGEATTSADKDCLPEDLVQSALCFTDFEV